MTRRSSRSGPTGVGERGVGYGMQPGQQSRDPIGAEVGRGFSADSGGTLQSRSVSLQQTNPSERPSRSCSSLTFDSGSDILATQNILLRMHSLSGERGTGFAIGGLICPSSGTGWRVGTSTPNGIRHRLSGARWHPNRTCHRLGSSISGQGGSPRNSGHASPAALG